MFDFQKLNVFETAVEMTAKARELAEDDSHDEKLTRLLVETSNQAALDIAYASSQSRIDDRKAHFEQARSSVYKCAGILVILNAASELPEEEYNAHIDDLNKLSRMLYSLAKKTTAKPKPAEAKAVAEAS